MSRNEILDEIRKTREELLARFNYDIDALMAHMTAEAKKSGRKFVSMPPRKPSVIEPVRLPEQRPASDAA